MSRADNVVPIRRAPSAPRNARCRNCGSEWWCIYRDTPDGLPGAAGGLILIETPDGTRIAGYSGRFQCMDCGTPR